jgi:predicted methyltransferase
MRASFVAIALAAILVGASSAHRFVAAPSAQAGDALERVIDSPARTAANRARDKYRHPAETLAFFGIRPGDTIVEMWPGGGWYTEILAPYLKAGGGTLYTLAPDKGLTGVRRMIADKPDSFGAIKAVPFVAGAASPTGIAPGSVDMVVTFRNVHNWTMGDQPVAADVFRQMFVMLKPGGILGIEDHRLPEDADSAREKDSGYLKMSTVRRLAQEAGFRFVSMSEINANPKDTADWPNGVWTLPPTLRNGAIDRDKYLAIGESDRMTLKFVKPAA